ncbi:MAG: anti-sigma factor [Hydrococcus sp. Prado102]|jgi:anti-sigma-K factor RskA|nr:anti-sigma factor [Hydrococcus sp. Prado102]
MREPLSPEQIEALMAGYVLNDLSPEEAQEFERMLRENPNLMEQVKRLQETLDVLPYALPEVEPPPSLREAILEATAPQPVRRVSRLPWGIAASIAALVALALGLDNYRLRQDLQLARQDLQVALAKVKTAQQREAAIDVLQQPNTRVFSLAGTDKANAASGSIAIDSQDKKAVIVIKNLPTPPEGQIYRLWAIIDDKKIACADFKATQQGNVLEEFSLPAEACSTTKSTLAVTLEPFPAPPQPVGPAVMVERS